jgi:hypothetical protein
VKNQKFDGTATVYIPQLNGRKIQFSQLDPVLSLSEPHVFYNPEGKKPKDLKECQICKSENPKDMGQCAFCASWGCKTCVYKQFPFPMQHVDLTEPDAEPVMGPICLECECKIHLNNVSKPHNHDAYVADENNSDPTTQERNQI